MKELQPGSPWADSVFRAAAVLYAAGARAVWLFGSRAQGRAPDRLSDFDLIVEGLPPGSVPIRQAIRELKGKVDLVRLESASPDIRFAYFRDRMFVPDVAARPERPSHHLRLPDSLAGLRTSLVAQRIREVAPASVIDLGCGAGLLLAELAADHRYERLTGVDIDRAALAAARRRIVRVRGAGPRGRIELHEVLITHRSPLFLCHDAVAAIEVIEHLERPQLEAFVGVVFDFVRPARAVITTPNAEFNALWAYRGHQGHRHADHRFEWTRAEFGAWAGRVSESYRYSLRIESVGTEHPDWGPPTQLAVFDREK